MISEKNIFEKFTKKLGDDTNEKYTLKNNVLYFHGIMKHDIAKIMDNDIYVKLDMTTKKYSLKLLKYCIENNIKEDRIKLVTHLFPEKTNISFEDFHWNNLDNMFYMYCKEDLFYQLKNINFNFSKSLAHYVSDLSLMSIFKIYCESALVNKYTGMEDKYDKFRYWIFLKRDWIIINSEIRNSISNIMRKIKIIIMIKNDNIINE
jgi:hypothetical protein